MGSWYQRAGVDIDLADMFVERIKKIVAPTQNKRVRAGVGGFASLFRLNKETYLVASTDGVGTKVKLAAELKQHRWIGQDLVAMCVNDLICTGATPLFFLDYFATGKLDLDVGVEVVRGIARACKRCDMALVGGETAEMPDVYPRGVYDLAGFVVGVVDKTHLITGHSIKEGDVMIGIASNGVHSNGYSLIRKVFSTKEKQWMRLALRPTPLYQPMILKFHRQYPGVIKGLAHITGSGFLNIPRINEQFDYVVTVRPALPPILKEVVRRTGMKDSESFTTFNMGVGMVVVTSPVWAKRFITFCNRNDFSSFILGRVESGSGRVILRFEQTVIL
ncbi:MAG: phosphoribosylformylglycinamidine cyclo-ligase [Bdellovibrionaceae bacterium]|nr:phosphoribosylformylglycinamidine cyclo-ligase [Pseudobdellovibrionaceae bacterium]MDW8189709.1 phosphoribosylformylglycinamidine cyclo-ligase [Pseudobdellovibrionaceae bacterium]